MDEAVKYDQGKLRYDLIPPEALEELVRVYSFGAAKYDQDQWRKGMSWRRVFAAIMRHTWAWMRGEDRDSESGLPHLAHAAWGCFTLLAYSRGCLGQDDRPVVNTAAVQTPTSTLLPVDEAAILNEVMAKATKHEPYLAAHANLHGEPRS